VLKYWEMDPEWLVQQSKLHDLQNRLGFVVALARSASRRSALPDSRRDKALEQLEATLRRSLLAHEELLAGARVSESERPWLKKHRSKEARDWNVLSNWRPEALRYVASCRLIPRTSCRPSGKTSCVKLISFLVLLLKCTALAASCFLPFTIAPT